MSEIERIKRHLDAVSGCQLATMISVSLLIRQHRGDQQVVAAIRQAGESTKANLLASQASDFKIQAFEETLGTLIESLS